MCSLKLIVTICFALSFPCDEKAFALNTTSTSLTNDSNDNLENSGSTTSEPKEIHNLFSTESRVSNSTTSTTISDKVSASGANNVLTKDPQDFHNATTETTMLVAPTTAAAAAGEKNDSHSSSTKQNAVPLSDQHTSSELAVSTAKFPLEGGGTVPDLHSTSSDASTKLNINSTQSSENLSLEKYSDTDQSMKTSNIVARKGVGSCSCCPNVTNSENCTLCCGSPSELNSGEEIDKSKGSGNSAVTNLGNNTVTTEQKTNSTLASPIEAKKNKATKPLYTVDAANDNVGNISSIQTSTKKIEQGSNYVVPVVGTILMVPLVVVLSVFMYKKGCEFWERRHYRRMDFLIDGMYND